MVAARGGHVGPSQRERVLCSLLRVHRLGTGGHCPGWGAPQWLLFGEQVVRGSMAPLSTGGGWGSRVLPVPLFSICCSIQCPGRGQPPPHLPVSQESPVPSVDRAGVLGMSSGSPAPLGHGRGSRGDRATSHPDSLLCPWGAGCSGQRQSPRFPCCRSSMRPWVH